MTILGRLDLTHTVVVKKVETPVGVRIAIVPERGEVIKNTKVIILIDVSNSMAGYKLQTALMTASSIISQLPPGNVVAVYKFAGKVVKLYEGPSGVPVQLPPLAPEPETKLHTALKVVSREVGNYPTKLIVLTDGQPTDKKYPDNYDSLLPPNIQAITIGIGRDYNEVILKRIADSTKGIFHHVENPQELPRLFASQSSQAYAINLEVISPKEFIPINVDLPIKFPIVSDFIQIIGFLKVPPGTQEARGLFQLVFEDPAVNNAHGVINLPYNIGRGDIPVVNQQLAAEIQFYDLLRKYSRELEQGKASSQTLEQLKATAQMTMRYDLIQTTQRLTGDPKTDLSQITQTMRKE
ncbi:hypothetical protein HS7_03560 [Sulfolobales archaeon HS-7]|nr:hypothetical protein HS7_03560 [Sulfolobales archaeon HS-7]